MIIYLDTSAFVKLVIDEDGADLARRWFDEASLATSSVITFPEACSALARRTSREAAGGGRLDDWLSELDARWTRTARVRVDERVAGRLAVAHSLRGMDAVHLGAAIAVRERALARSRAAIVTVAAFDRRLLEAAEREGFATLGGPLTT
jgi:predicted nucleic acid-binding protein